MPEPGQHLLEVFPGPQIILDGFNEVEEVQKASMKGWIRHGTLTIEKSYLDDECDGFVAEDIPVLSLEM